MNLNLQERAETLKDGRAMLDFLEQQHIRERLYRAAKDGNPSMSSIYGDLMTKFGPQRVSERIVWEFICDGVQEIMTNAGYQTRRDQGRFSDRLSKRDLIYTKHEQRLDNATLEAMIGGLDRSQLDEVMELAEEAIEHDRSVTRINLGEMRRTAETLKHGEAILDFLSEEEVGDRLLQAAQQGESPILCIYDDLVGKFGPQVEQAPVEEFICNVGYAILKEKGYLPDSPGRLRREGISSREDRTYEKVTKDKYYAEILWAMMCGLDEHQLDDLIELVEYARGDIDDLVLGLP